MNGRADEGGWAKPYDEPGAERRRRSRERSGGSRERARRASYDPEDPVELVGVGLDAALDDDALREMAVAFVEEYALLGWPPERILRLFASPRFAGPHRVWRALGEDAVRALVATAFPELRRDDARSLDEEAR